MAVFTSTVDRLLADIDLERQRKERRRAAFPEQEEMFDFQRMLRRAALPQPPGAAAVELLPGAVPTPQPPPAPLSRGPEAPGELYWLGEAERAGSDAEVALSLGLRDPRVHLVLARAAESQGNWQSVARHAQRALELDPKAVEPYRLLARVHEARGQLDEALAALDKATAAHPDDWRTYVARARLHYQRGSHAAALADAAATAVANEIHAPEDIPRGIGRAQSIEGVTGAVIVVGDQLGAFGEVELERL